MKNKILKSLSVLSVSILAAGCIEETFPQGSVQTQDQVSSSDSGLKAMISAIPNSLVQAGFAGHLSRYKDQLDFGMASIHLRTDHMLEDIVAMGDNPGYDWAIGYAGIAGFGPENVMCSYFWDCYYPWIKGANDVISLVNPETAAPEIKALLGQALTYRAMFYLDMARLYQPVENKYTDVSAVLDLTVPIVKETTTEEDAKNNPRVKKDVMYDFILTDLKNAAEYLKDEKGPSTQPTIGAVYGLMARAYLEMGYWEGSEVGGETAFKNAYDYAQKAIEASGRTPLTEAQWTDPKTGFNSATATNSWIWGLPVTVNNVGNLVAWPAHLSMEATWGYSVLSHIGINKATYESITEGDFRKKSWLDPDWTGFGGSYKADYKFAGSTADAQSYVANAVPYESIKFRPGNGNTQSWQEGNVADVVMMRVEEMYFIQMEAKAHSDLGAAKTLLDNYMNNYRMIGGSGYACASKVSDLESFLDEMLFQKRIEFWGEGIVFYDYKRLKEGVTRGYAETNHPLAFCYNTEGPSPLWNIVISRLEYQANTVIQSQNNPDPSGKLVLWNGK